MCNYTDLISHCHQKGQDWPCCTCPNSPLCCHQQKWVPWQTESGSVSDWTWVFIFPLGWFSAGPLPRSCLPGGGTSISTGNVRLGAKSPLAAVHTAVWVSSTIWCQWHCRAMLVRAIWGRVCLSWACAYVCVTISMCRSFLIDITELSSQAWKLVHTWFLSGLGKASPSCCHEYIFSFQWSSPGDHPELFMGYVWQLQGFACQLDYILYISSRAWNSAWSFGFLLWWPSLSFNRCMLWCPSVCQVPGKQQQDRNPPRMYLPFPPPLRVGSWGAAYEQFNSCWTMSSVSSCGPAGASGFDSFGLSELTAMQSTQLWPIKSNESSCHPWEMIYALWLVALWKFVCLYRSCPCCTAIWVCSLAQSVAAIGHLLTQYGA